MTDFKVGQVVRRVRNTVHSPYDLGRIKIGEKFQIAEIVDRYLESTTGNFVVARDCDLVEEAITPRDEFYQVAENKLLRNVGGGYQYPKIDADCLIPKGTCKTCGQALPKPKTLTVPEHTIPAPLDVEPEDGSRVWTVGYCGALEIVYCGRENRWRFNYGLLYATVSEAQARYESWVAPTRRGEEG